MNINAKINRKKNFFIRALLSNKSKLKIKNFSNISEIS